ncbi:MAG: permease-like cell division protein FtsX [Syntrophomonadaceae bacterium]|jgi:cell division transport system permease protein
MRFRNFIYFLVEAFKSIKRNRILSIATMTTVAICIMILGLFLLMSLNAGNFMRELESDLEIIAFVDKEIEESRIAGIEEEINEISGISSIKFVSREESLERLQEKFGDADYNLAETLGENPLPHTYEIKAVNAQDVPGIALQIKDINGITKVKYGQDIVERIFSVTKWVRIVSLVLIVFLLLGAIFLIATTIRLSIYARRKEVALMKLVGSTDWFIRWPFFIEGMVLGAVGSIISVLILAFGYAAILENTELLIFLPLIRNPGVLMKFYITLFATGLFIGLLGTSISLNRFLNV